MDSTELKTVADHMGHDLSIHMNIYRDQCSILQRTKLARLLIAMENGMVSRYAGKSLNEIDLDGKLFP